MLEIQEERMKLQKQVTKHRGWVIRRMW